MPRSRGGPFNDPVDQYGQRQSQVSMPRSRGGPFNVRVVGGIMPKIGLFQCRDLAAVPSTCRCLALALAVGQVSMPRSRGGPFNGTKGSIHEEHLWVSMP